MGGKDPRDSRRLDRSPQPWGHPTLRRLRFRPKYNVSDLDSLLIELEQNHCGVPLEDLEDAYEGAKQDIERAILRAQLIAVKIHRTKDLVLFPRGDRFLVRLSGTVTADPQRPLRLATTHDLLGEVRRGDAVELQGAGQCS